METTFTNQEVKNLVNDNNKRYGGVSGVKVGDKFTLPAKEKLNEAIQVRTSTTVYADRSALETAVTNAKVREGYTQTENGAWKRDTKYLVVACEEGDLAFGTLCSAAGYNGTDTNLKTAASQSKTKECKGRGTQVVEWLEKHAGQKLEVKVRQPYTVTTRNGDTFPSNLTTFK